MRPSTIFIKNFSNPKKKSNLLSYLLMIVGFLALADIAFFAFAPYTLIYPKQSAAETPKADVGAVLFNSLNDERTGLNEESTRRVNHGINLFRQAKFKHLLLVGGTKATPEKSGAAFMADYAREAGIPETAIFTGHGSHDSQSNLSSIQSTMAANQWQSLVLISSPYHLGRINRIGLGPLAGKSALSPYDPFSCNPAVTRFEAWASVHVNLIAEMLWRMMPDDFYREFVRLVRTYTCF